MLPRVASLTVKIYTGPKAIDNDFNSFWESANSCDDSTQDIMIDLGQEYYIGAVKITWGFSSYDANKHIGGEIRIWNEQNGWNTVMNMYHPLNEQPEFYHLHPNYGQKIMFKCYDLEFNIKISEIEIFEAKSNWHQFDFDNDGINNGNDNAPPVLNKYLIPTQNHIGNVDRKIIYVIVTG